MGTRARTQCSTCVQNHFFGIFVLSTDFAADVFFWVSAFLASYLFLAHTHKNDGKQPNKCAFVLNRLVRLAPLYYFTLLFFWRFMVLLGGDGPMFFGYD